VTEAYDIPDWTYLFCVFADSSHACVSNVTIFLGNVGKKFVNPYKPYSSKNSFVVG